MNKTSWIIISIAGGACLLIGIFMLWPGFSKDWQTLSETKKAKTELQELAQKKTVLLELSKNTDLDSITQAAAGYIPEDAKSSELILELTAIANQSGLAVEEISLDSTQPAQTAKTEDDGTATTTQAKTPATKTIPAKTVGFSLKVKGSFENLMQYFKLVETSSRLITIANLGLTQSKEDFTAELTGTAYSKAAPKAEVQNVELSAITVTKETLAKFANLTQYSTPIDTSTESGFGRTNPFAEIK